MHDKNVLMFIQYIFFSSIILLGSILSAPDNGYYGFKGKSMVVCLGVVFDLITVRYLFSIENQFHVCLLAPLMILYTYIILIIINTKLTRLQTDRFIVERLILQWFLWASIYKDESMRFFVFQSKIILAIVISIDISFSFTKGFVIYSFTFMSLAYFVFLYFMFVIAMG
jgi:hypothetical protein